MVVMVEMAEVLRKSKVVAAPVVAAGKPFRGWFDEQR